MADGIRIRAARLKRGLTQEQLATMADMDVKTVRKAEQGKRLDLGPLNRIASVLQIELSKVVRRRRSSAQDRRKEVVMRWIKIWEDQDGAALAALYHEHAVLRLPGAPNIPFSGMFRGRNEIRQANEAAWASCRTAPPEVGDVSLLAVDDTVLMQGYKGVALPNGGFARLWCLQVFTFEGDLIIDHRVEYDTLNFAQLLQFPTPDTHGEKTGNSP